MKTSVLPKTTSGKWSVELAIVSLVIFESREILKIYASMTPGRTFFSNPLSAATRSNWELGSAVEAF